MVAFKIQDCEKEKEKQRENKTMHGVWPNEETKTDKIHDKFIAKFLDVTETKMALQFYWCTRS